MGLTVPDLYIWSMHILESVPPRYSQAFKSVGQPVSYQNIQAGDVVVYPGHVAIYIGNGNIVEAQSTRAGITNSRPVNCHTITAIRRLV